MGGLILKYAKMTEKINMAIINSGRAYQAWDMDNGLPTYLSVILYELFYHKRLSQKELVERSGIPKQSINKGIKLLQEKDYLICEYNGGDRRVKECYLTKAGLDYAKIKVGPLFDLEDEIIYKMGVKRVEKLTELLEEYSHTLWELVKEDEKL